jgi:hypothetical protein
MVSATEKREGVLDHGAEFRLPVVRGQRTVPNQELLENAHLFFYQIYSYRRSIPNQELLEDAHLFFSFFF